MAWQNPLLQGDVNRQSNGEPLSLADIETHADRIDAAFTYRGISQVLPSLPRETKSKAPQEVYQGRGRVFF